jgi:RNA polymerase sigma-70 factor (ECF subfamily)
LREAENTLARACAKGDRNAQKTLYEQYKTPLYRLCLRYARDAQEAEDFLHEAFLRIFSDIHQFKGRGALGGWLRRVALNNTLQLLRRSQHWQPVEEEDAWISEAEEDTLPPPPPMAELLAHIQRLPAGYRTVFNLYVLDQYTHQDIARELGISVGASKSQLSKAKAQLRRQLSATTTTP